MNGCIGVDARAFSPSTELEAAVRPKMSIDTVSGGEGSGKSGATWISPESAGARFTMRSGSLPVRSSTCLA